MTTNEPVTYLGAKLRQLASEHGSGVTQLGSLFVRVTNHGNEWARAVGVVPETGYGSNNKQHTIVRLTWTGTEEPAAAGTQAFYLNRK